MALSNVTVNGNNIQTIFVNYATLQATVPASLVANSGTLQISVVNPPQNTNPNIPPGGGSSNFVSLNVTNPVPAIGALSPVSGGAGAASTVVTVNGGNFVPNSVVMFNGSPRTTTFGGSGSLQVSLSSSDLASAGANQVQVINPAPGGGTSTAVAFPVVPSTVAGLPVTVDVGYDASQANNGICGGLTNCQNGTLALVQGLTPAMTPLTSSGPSTSGSGEFLAFASFSNNLVLGQKSTGSQVFLRDTCLSASASTSLRPGHVSSHGRAWWRGRERTKLATDRRYLRHACRFHIFGVESGNESPCNKRHQPGVLDTVLYVRGYIISVRVAPRRRAHLLALFWFLLPQMVLAPATGTATIRRLAPMGNLWRSFRWPRILLRQIR